VLISGGRTPKAFDIYTDRKLRYTLANGVPDPPTSRTISTPWWRCSPARCRAGVAAP
jgi:hypothetical protein